MSGERGRTPSGGSPPPLGEPHAGRARKISCDPCALGPSCVSRVRRLLLPLSTTAAPVLPWSSARRWCLASQCRVIAHRFPARHALLPVRVSSCDDWATTPPACTRSNGRDRSAMASLPAPSLASRPVHSRNGSVNGLFALKRKKRHALRSQA